MILAHSSGIDLASASPHRPLPGHWADFEERLVSLKAVFHFVRLKFFRLQRLIAAPILSSDENTQMTGSSPSKTFVSSAEIGENGGIRTFALAAKFTRRPTKSGYPWCSQ